MRIRQSMRRTHRRSRSDGANWLSFSDLMSTLLLIFILIMFYIMYQYFDMYETNMAEIARQQYDLDQANASLDEKTAKLTRTEQQMIAQRIKLEAAQKDLTEAESVLADQQKELTDAQNLLDEKEAEITVQRAALDQLSAQLGEKQTQIQLQQDTLAQQQQTMAQQQQTLDQQQTRLDQQQQTMDQQRQTLDQQQTRLDQQQQTLNSQQTQLKTAQKDLTDAQSALAQQQQALDEAENTLVSQQRDLVAAQNLLGEKEKEITGQQTQLNQLSSQLNQQENQIKAQQQALEAQQVQIEQLVGLKTRIISSLSDALKAANISAQVDPANGSIALESDVMFELNKYVLSARGRQFIDEFLPVYLDVLLSEDYRPYVTEIIIEGHTDTTGDYITNLRLSQQRALSVASYVLSDSYRGITAAQKNLLRKLATANGRSWSDPLYDAFGNVDMDASRRVVFKFRMTDEQMIQQLKDIMEPE